MFVSKKQKEKIKEEVREQVLKEEVAKIKAQFLKEAQPMKSIERNTRQAFRPQPVDFSEEQNMLRQLFGHGEGIWGLEDSTTQVQINRTLFSGETETGNLFGMGSTPKLKDDSTRRHFF